MSKRTVEELMTEFRGIVGDSTDDAVIAFLENLVDSLGDIDTTELKDLKSSLDEVTARYNDLKERYRDRFYNKDNENSEEPVTGEPSDMKEDIKIKDLFIEEDK